MKGGKEEGRKGGREEGRKGGREEEREDKWVKGKEEGSGQQQRDLPC